MLLDKTSYINVIEEILNNHTKVSNLKISTSKKISYITNFDKRKTSDIKLLNNEEMPLRKRIFKGQAAVDKFMNMTVSSFDDDSDTESLASVLL